MNFVELQAWHMKTILTFYGLNIKNMSNFNNVVHIIFKMKQNLWQDGVHLFYEQISKLLEIVCKVADLAVHRS